MRGIMIEPMAAMAADDEPEIAPNSAQVTMVTAPSPPLSRPTKRVHEVEQAVGHPPFGHDGAGHHEERQREQGEARGGLVGEGNEEGDVRARREAEHQRADAEGEGDRHLQEQQDDDERDGGEKDQHG